MRRTIPLLALLLVLLAFMPASAQSSTGLDAREFTLDNGLKVIVVNRPGVPVVSSYVWYKVGSMDETPGITGMAHFLEHMMFKGSRNYEVGEVDRVTVRNGGSNNAFTSYDFTAYYIDLPKARYVEALKIEADRMRYLTLDQGEFDSEKKVVQSESDIAADNPSQRLWTKMNSTLHGEGHPYSHHILGNPEDVESMTREQMETFYKRHYHPNHATLLLVGDITIDEARQSVTRHFEDIPRGPELQRPKPRTVNFNGPRSIEVAGDSSVVEFGRQYLTVPAGHADVEPLQILGVILGGGVTSRLYRALVDDDGIATSVAAGHGANMLSGSFWTWAELAEGRSREELAAGVQGVIDALIADGVSDAELTRARNRVLAGIVFRQESASSIASTLGEAETVHGDWRLALALPDRIRDVTAEDVRRVARRYLRLERSVTGWQVPEPSPQAADNPESDESEPGVLPVQRHVLDNGLTVLLLERRGLPLLTMTASVRSGRAAEGASEAGLSSFTGTLLDAGTKGWSKQELAELLEGVGGSLSAGTDGATVRLLSDHRSLGVRVLAEVLQSPTFPENEVDLLRRQTLAMLEASKNETDWFARAAAMAAVYGPDNPLGRPAQGSEASVRGFTREQVQQWHARWFRPDNCVVAAVGDFDATALLAEIKAGFGDWAKPAEPLEFPTFDFVRPQELEGEQIFHFSNFDFARVDPNRKRIAVDHPEKDQVVLRLQTIGITRDNPDYFPLLVMDNILGTSPGFTDRFSRVLRDQMGLAYSTFANITGGSGNYPGAFLGYIGTRPENVEGALATMYALLEEIRTEPVSDEELATAKDYLKGSFVFNLETTSQLANLLVSMERFDLGFDYVLKYADAVDAVTAEDIRRVANQYLVPDQMVEIISGPVTRIGAGPDEE